MQIHYVTGSRADFGLIVSTLQFLDNQDDFGVKVVATGQHTNSQYGDTIQEIVKSGLENVATVPVCLSGADGAEMAKAIGAEIIGFVEVWQENRPDLVMVLGDRGEMLAAAIAAVHLGIHVVHIHGGELSGTVDESTRHAISKMAHFHFVASRDSEERLSKMGEHSDRIFCVGAPGLVGIDKFIALGSREYHQEHRLGESDYSVVMLFHPTVQEAEQAANQVKSICEALMESDCCGVILRPNSDAGGELIDEFLDGFDTGGRFRIITHLARSDFLKLVSNVDAIVGNSSCGIIESASLGTACVNIGSRQNRRLRNENVIDCNSYEKRDVKAGLKRAWSIKGPFVNKYGDGNASQRILEALRRLELSDDVLKKVNAY